MFRKPPRIRKVGYTLRNSHLVQNFEKKIVGLFFYTIINAAGCQEIVQGFIAKLDEEDRFCWFKQDGTTGYMTVLVMRNSVDIIDIVSILFGIVEYQYFI